MKFINVVLLIIAVFMVSTSAIFVKLIDVPVEVLAFYRLFISFVVFFIVMLFSKKLINEYIMLSKKSKCLMIISGIMIAIHYLLWFESLKYTSVASSTVIVTLQPIFAMFGGFLFFKERFQLGAILGMLIAIIGSIVISYHDFKISGLALYGDIIALIAALIITIYFFIGQHVRMKTSLVVYATVSYGGSAIFLIFINIVKQNNLIQYDLYTWIIFFGLAFCASIIGQTLFNYLLKFFNTTVISMTILGEVIGTCILSYFILHEVTTLSQLIGISLILIGQVLFILANRGNRKV